MKYFNFTNSWTKFLFGACAAMCLTASTILIAQAQDTPQSRVIEVSEKIDELMTQMEERAASYPEVLEQLRKNKENAANAEQIVDNLITDLKSLTLNMGDGEELQKAIIDFQTLTSDLIAEAEASGDDIIKAEVPNLRESLGILQDSDTLRAAKVIEARNAIRDLEDNRARISFFIRAGNLTRAANAIEASVLEFSDIIDGAKELAAELISEASSP